TTTVRQTEDPSPVRSARLPRDHLADVDVHRMRAGVPVLAVVVRHAEHGVAGDGGHEAAVDEADVHVEGVVEHEASFAGVARDHGPDGDVLDSVEFDAHRGAFHVDLVDPHAGASCGVARAVAPVV